MNPILVDRSLHKLRKMQQKWRLDIWWWESLVMNWHWSVDFQWRLPIWKIKKISLIIYAIFSLTNKNNNGLWPTKKWGKMDRRCIEKLSDLDSGCGLFFYRIYEEYHINLCECSMYGYCQSLIHSLGYNKIHIQSVSSVIEWKLKPG